MKTGMYIRVGSYNKDLTEATVEELDAWLTLLDRKALINTVKVLVFLFEQIEDPEAEERGEEQPKRGG